MTYLLQESIVLEGRLVRGFIALQTIKYMFPATLSFDVPSFSPDKHTQCESQSLSEPKTRPRLFAAEFQHHSAFPLLLEVPGRPRVSAITVLGFHFTNRIAPPQKFCQIPRIAKNNTHLEIVFDFCCFMHMFIF